MPAIALTIGLAAFVILVLFGRSDDSGNVDEDGDGLDQGERRNQLGGGGRAGGAV